MSTCDDAAYLGSSASHDWRMRDVDFNLFYSTLTSTFNSGTKHARTQNKNNGRWASCSSGNKEGRSSRVWTGHIFDGADITLSGDDAHELVGFDPA